MSNELVKQENVEMIVKNAPQSYNENQISHDRCIETGKKLLADIHATGGMNDELDQRAAEFINRARNTVKKMNDKRSPVTKLFDEIRTVFTNMESDVDPAKPDSIPGKLQKMRNDFAAKKRAEAEARRREEELRQRVEVAKNRYRLAVEDDYQQSFNRMLNASFNELSMLNNSITLKNFEQQETSIRNFPITLSEDKITLLPSGAMIPAELNANDSLEIRRQVMTKLLPKFREQYRFDIGENRDNILFMLPSKKKELEAISQASAEEARRREEEMKLREAEEARKREEERLRKEEEERNRLKVQQQQTEMTGLFSKAAISTPFYQPKLQVKKKIVIKSPLGFLDVINLWWTTEGCELTVDELSKKFKSQITHCEKLANDKSNPHFIQSNHISYEDEVKAK